MTQELPDKRILVVDDDIGLLRLVEKRLVREGLVVVTASSAASARETLAANRADLALLDLKLGDASGEELVKALAGNPGFPPFIIITGQGDERVAVEMMKAGALDYLVKDKDFLDLLPKVVKRALRQLDQESQLRLAEERVHLVQSAVEQGFSAVLIAEGSLPDPIVSYVNPALTKSIGCDAADLQGRPLGEIQPLAPLTERLGAGLAPGEPFREGISVIEAPGGERFVEWRFSPVKHKTGGVGHWLLLFRDITERRRLEREILEISDRERQRMGQDLHDGICQQLAGIELMSQVLEQKLARRSRADAARAGEIARYVREAISQTRSVARGLSPVTLEAEGLESALRELAANTEKMFGIRCQVIIKESCARCELGAGIHYYRIAQEAVSNALKHGKATEIWIGLEARSDRTILSVEDNGFGLTGGWSAGGMGLRIMRYRAGMLGGTLVLEAREPRGTRVVCTTGPLKSQKPDRI